MQSLVKNRKITINKNHVLKAIECYPESPVYEEVCDLFEELYPKALEVIAPQVVWVAEPNDGTNRIPELAHCDELIYATTTLGYGIIEAIEGYFQRQELMEGMLLDAIATGILFKLNEQLYKELYTYISNQHKGVIALSPGERGTPITYQKIIEEKLGGMNGIRVTEGYLLEPIKSTSSIYGVGSGMELPEILHNCKKCQDATCKWRLAPYEG